MYRMHRVFCGTAWELEGERQAFYSALGEFNEAEGMPRGVLYVPVSLTNVRDKRPYQYLVDENIRDCRRYLLAITGDWGPVERNFRRDWRLANACLADPALPMAGVAILLRQEPGETPAFASELAAAGIEPILFADQAGFREQVMRLLASWIDADSAAAASTAGA